MSLVELAPSSRFRSDGRSRAAAASPGWITRHREPLGLFTAAFAGYVAVGAVLVFHYHVIVRDAMSRVDNASFVLFSRDPHLAAVGFVWNPLLSLLELPLLLFKPIFPALLTDAFAGNIVSALLMGGSVVALSGIARDLGLSPATRTVLVATFALNPMIVYYGANGMSEAAFVFSVVWATRGALRWARHEETAGLASAGVALAIGYLARYEAAVAAAGLALFVFAASFRRNKQREGHGRLQSSLLDTGILAFPPLLAFILLTGASWVIVGSPFPQLTSQYGNSAQTTELGITGAHASGQLATAFGHVAEQVLALEPLAVVILMFALAVAVVAKTLIPLVPAAAILPVLAFEAFAEATGQTFGWLRFYILVIPMCSITVAVLVANIGARPRVWQRATLHVSFGVVIAALLLGYPTTVEAWGNSSLAPEESCYLSIARHLPPPACQPVFRSERQVAHFFDSKHLPNGSVLLDSFEGFPIVGESQHPKQFVITSDLDFKQVLADPPTFHVRYLVTIPPTGLGASDALNVAYPGIYATGDGLGRQVASFPAPAGSQSPDYRIYLVTASSATGA